MTKTEAQKIWDANIQETAATYNNEFAEAELDSEWSSTGFTESGRKFNEAVEVLSKDWSDYHYEIQGALNEIDAEIGIDSDGTETANFAGGVFVI